MKNEKFPRSRLVSGMVSMGQRLLDLSDGAGKTSPMTMVATAWLDGSLAPLDDVKNARERLGQRVLCMDSDDWTARKTLLAYLDDVIETAELEPVPYVQAWYAALSEEDKQALARYRALSGVVQAGLPCRIHIPDFKSIVLACCDADMAERARAAEAERKRTPTDDEREKLMEELEKYRGWLSMPSVAQHAKEEIRRIEFTLSLLENVPRP